MNEDIKVGDVVKFQGVVIFVNDKMIKFMDEQGNVATFDKIFPLKKV